MTEERGTMKVGERERKNKKSKMRHQKVGNNNE